MKKFNKSFLYKISSLCIALGGLIYAQGMCMMFFGEPDFKEVKRRLRKKAASHFRFAAFYPIYKSPLFMISYNEVN